MLAMEESHGIAPTTVRMVIVQPRYHHADGFIRTFEIDSYTLRMEWAEDLLEAAHETLNPNAALVSGEHCRFCPAQAKCPRLHEQAVALAQTEFDDEFSPPEPETLDEAQISNILAKADAFKSWVNSVQAYAQHKLESGGHVPGYKLVARRARRKWIDEDDTPEILTSLGLSEDEMYVTKLISPAQAETLLGKKKAVKEEIAKAVIAVSSGNTIAPVSDRRQAVPVVLGSEFDEPLALEHEAFKNFE
jgi:hypothetical protein